MEDKELKQAMATLSAHLEQANLSLRALSLLQLAQEFYTKEERDDFYARLATMKEQADEAREVARDNRPGDSRTWEEYAAEVGREEVAAIRKRIREALDKAQEIDGRVRLYQDANPILSALLQQRGKLI